MVVRTLYVYYLFILLKKNSNYFIQTKKKNVNFFIDSGVPQDQQQIVVDRHNYHRQQLLAGNVPNQPQATQMQNLVLPLLIFLLKNFQCI